MYGADDVVTAEAVRLCFQGEFENLSDFVSSENWKVTKMGFFQSKKTNIISVRGKFKCWNIGQREFATAPRFCVFLSLYIRPHSYAH